MRLGSGQGERFGLLLIGSALLVILAVTGLWARHQRDARLEQNRVQGVSLVRLLSRIPLARLATGPNLQGPLQVMRHSQGNPDFAYGTVVDPEGKTLAEVAAAGVIVPRRPLPAEPSAWLGERLLESAKGERAIREFHAPVIEDGRLVAHVRVGFLEPGLAVAFSELPAVGAMALLIFLLAPVSYFLLRREVRPLAQANLHIQRLLEGQRLEPVQIEATGALAEFAERFNSMLNLAQSRVRELESGKMDLLASSKVLAYRTSRMESVLASLPDAALVLDETGAVSFANARVEALLGVTPDAVQGQRIGAWSPDPALVSFLALYAGDGPRLARPQTLDLELGGKHLRVGAHPLVAPGPGGQTTGTLVLARDVTTEHLAVRNQAEFVAHVAHELKAPLNVLSMYSETLLGKDGESEDFRIEACNVIQDEVERLSSLVNTMLSIARLETGTATLERQRVRLGEFLRDVLEAVSRGGQRAGLRFELNVPNETPPLFVDKELLRVAVNNLLTNAIKYNRSDGTVELGAEDRGESVVIRVRDTGIGVTPDERARIFDKFYRSEREEARARGGHGLGLALVKEIVERHGGRIEVESTPGEGSEFRLILRKTGASAKEAR